MQSIFESPKQVRSAIIAGSASIQGEFWGARAGDWADINEPAWWQVFETAMKKAGAGPGKRVLDVGCGAGGALVIAREMGADVTGVEASVNLAGIAVERLPGARIDVCDMEALPLDCPASAPMRQISGIE